ncbi:hypothetical protein VTN77DRAFT_9112 [Rasamsonia byssochlamydoides]|uniref:uncharacterized protein n=1 Tax=Rasamsonia byssochlamydoides TaxID=89139 RepID=UPI0037424E5C
MDRRDTTLHNLPLLHATILVRQHPIEQIEIEKLPEKEMVRPKKVAIVGAGPSGLVTAKTLLHNFPKHRFEPVVFDHRRTVGGLWTVPSPDNRNQRQQHNHGLHHGQEKSFDGSTSPSTSSFISPSMRTNLSRFTVCFSDFAWESLSSGLDDGDGDGGSDGVPMFPQAWQVGRYLDRYAERYIPREVLRLGCRVVRTERRTASESNDAAADDDGNWMVEWMEESDETQPATRSERFDHLVVASGYFSRPHIPDIPGLREFNPDRMIHSSALRDVEEFLLRLQELPGSMSGKLVVVGGSLSGAEAASSLALHLSSSAHAPAPALASRCWDYTVHHISTRPFWAVPTYLPASTPSASSFLPLDLVMYDLSRRPPGEIEYSFGPVPPQRSISVNQYFESLLGTDQSDIGDGSLGGNDRERPPWVAVTDSYAEFVRSGDVNVTIGRVCAVHFPSSSHGLGTLEVQLTTGERTTLEDVAAIVFATGFTPFDSLSFLPRDVLSQLEYSEDDPFFPLVLDGKGTLHADVPDLGFVGIYRGPYWGVMEMQARSLTQRWDQIDKKKSSTVGNSDRMIQERQQFRNLREADARLARAQFPMGDYVGLMESFARDLGIARYELPGQDRRSGPVVPARYAAPAELNPHSQMEVTAALNSLQAVLSGNQSQDGSGAHQLSTAKAIFRALQGKWRYSRVVKAADTTSSVSSSGIASFHPRYPSAAGYEGEYLCDEVENSPHLDTNDNNGRRTRRVRSVWRFREYASTHDNKEPVHVDVWTADDRKAAGRYSHGLRFVCQRDDDNNDNDNCNDNKDHAYRYQHHHARGTATGSSSSPLGINIANVAHIANDKDTTTLQPEKEQAHEHGYEHEYEYECEYIYTFRTKGVTIVSWEATVYSSSPLLEAGATTPTTKDSVSVKNNNDPGSHNHIFSSNDDCRCRYRYRSRTVYER